MNYNRQLKVFVSSPNDVKKERKIVDNVITKINNAVGDTLGFYLTVEQWEKMPPETTEEELQERLNEKIKECHFFLLILNKRYGTTMPDKKISNTEREINTIIEYLPKEDYKKKLLSYFKNNPVDNDPGIQQIQVDNLKAKLKANPNFFYKDYNSAQDFEDKLTHDLYNILIKMRLRTYKTDQLKKFWKFGKLENQTSPKTFVVYPPVPREWMGIIEHPNVWDRRLLPNLFFEDFKALHKILKNLSMVGLSEYKVYSKFDTPQDFDKANIIWICLPRQNKGLDTLRNKKNKNFEIIPRHNNKEPYIKWKTADGNWIDVCSPLLEYLKEQRSHAEVWGEWDRMLSNIIAKDYAVIARFNRDVPYNQTPGIDKLKEYFLTGIHGLGTWGAAWYIDRYYGKFDNALFENSATLEILIEIEYRDGRIYNVKDVSHEPKSYFKEQLSKRTIHRYINQYKEM